jgi:hypothetical protein
MKSFSCLILTIALFSFGCAHNSTSILSLSSTHPPLQKTAFRLAADPQQRQVTSEELTPEQSASQPADPRAEQGPPVTAEVKQGQEATDSQEVSEDLSDKDLEFEKELDFLEGEGEEVATVADPLEPFNRAVFHFNDKVY